MPKELYSIPFGEAEVVREGNDVTIITLAEMVHESLHAADTMAKDGIECDVIDLRTTSPLDEETVLDSVAQTGRVVVVDEANPRCSIATDISALIAQNVFDAIKAPIRMVTAPHTPVPFADNLEDIYKPNAETIAAAVHQVSEYQTWETPVSKS